MGHSLLTPGQSECLPPQELYKADCYVFRSPFVPGFPSWPHSFLLILWIPVSLVLVNSGCHSKISSSGWLEQLRFISSKFWRPQSPVSRCFRDRVHSFFLISDLFFISGCAGPWWLHTSFLELEWAGATLRRRAQASRCCGFSCCRAWL